MEGTLWEWSKIAGTGKGFPPAHYTSAYFFSILFKTRLQERLVVNPKINFTLVVSFFPFFVDPRAKDACTINNR